MWTKKVSIVLTVGMMVGTLWAGSSQTHPAHGNDPVLPGVPTLSPGYYTAKIGAITCGGCGPTIEKTMRQVPGIGAAQVDPKEGTVRFAVLVNKEVQVAQLQEALKVSADQMGMGADYKLTDIKKIKKGSK
ncbi:MAG: heavy-metal-associated domain-containing protein [Elusimicrobia bacterium]|nr:heavy-metal-associated domain-containing protein [Elusimicrobiota bacterium]